MKFDIDDFEVKDAENTSTLPSKDDIEMRLVEEVKESDVFNGEIIYTEEPAVSEEVPVNLEETRIFSTDRINQALERENKSVEMSGNQSEELASLIDYVDSLSASDEELVQTEEDEFFEDDSMEDSDEYYEDEDDMVEEAEIYDDEDMDDDLGDLGDLNYHDEDVVPVPKKRPAPASKPVKREEPVKKAAPAKNGEPVKKAAPAKNAEPVKKAAPAKNGEPVKKAAPAKNGEPVKKVAPAKNGEPVKKVAPAKNAEPAKKAEPSRGAEPAKKAAAPVRNSNNGKPAPANKDGKYIQKKQRPEEPEKKSSGNKLKDFFSRISFVDITIGIVGIALLVVLLVFANVFLIQKLTVTKVGSFASVGSQLEGLEGIGTVGIKGVITQAADNVEIMATDDKDEVVPITVTFTSVEKDLKIKFENRIDDALIQGVAFEIEALGPDKKEYLWVDEDKDGIIYQEKIPSGEYLVTIKSVEEYHFPETATKVTVKDKITYTAINIINEIKTEDQVNAAAEDTENTANVDSEALLSDTVEWVESSKTIVGGADGYAPIEKTTIKDPQTLVASGPSRFFKVAEIEIEAGKTAKLSAKSKISDFDEDTYAYVYSWSSSNNSVAQIVDGSDRETAIVEASTKGDVTIFCYVTITNKETKVSDSKNLEFSVTVKSASEEPSENPSEKPSEPTGVISNLAIKSSLSLKVGESETLTPTITPDDAKKDVTWKSSDDTIVKVENGKVTALKAGSATITCTSVATGSDGKTKSATCKVTVTSGDLKVTLKEKEHTVLVGETYTIEPTVTDYSSDKSVTYASSNEKVATVDNKGVVTGVAVGTAVITVSTKETMSDGKSATATVTITVKANPKKDTSTPLKDESGNQVYVKNAEGKYVEAKWADYYTASAFYITATTTYKYTGWQTINGKTYFYDKNGKYVTGEQVIQGVKYNFASDGSLSMNGGVLGIDVSKWNGSIDWNAVKESGISFVIIRCGYRGSATGVLVQDPKFTSYITGANKAGLKVGIYFFSQAINEIEAVEEASMAIALAKNYKISYPVYIDTEKTNNGRANGISRETRTAVCKAFCETVKNAGYTPGVYACKSWYNDSLNASALNGYKIWLAQYASQPSYSGRYDMWQYSEKGKVKGIEGNVDMNISYLGY